MSKKLWLLLSSMLLCCDSFKVLVLFPMPCRNRAALGEALVRLLVKAGHEVTYITPFPHEDPAANLRIIDVNENIESYFHTALSAEENIETIIQNKIKSESHIRMISTTTSLMKTTTENKDVKKLLNDPDEQFDVVIAEWMFTDLPAGYAAIFNCPFIWLSPIEVHWLVLSIIDDALSPAYTVDFTSQYSPPLTYHQRLSELWIQVKVEFMKFLYLDDYQGSIFDSVMAPIVLKRGLRLPYYNDVRFNISMVLGNSYISFDQAIALPQTYKPIGGFHIDEDVEPLPMNLQKIMNESTDGVIYFSMGFSLKSKTFPNDDKTSLLKMFGKLNQTVLWRYEGQLPDVPPNVHLVDTSRQQQQAILAHPNCTLFITNGDLLAVTEAIHFAVPIIGIPIIGDQFLNVIKSEKKGFGKKVDVSYNFPDELKEAIVEVTTNPGYAQKVKELSFIHHDRPTKPGAELVHWVEHVVRTHGARHLRSAAVDVPFYQKIYLDFFIIAFVFMTCVFITNHYCSVCMLRIVEDHRIRKNN